MNKKEGNPMAGKTKAKKTMEELYPEAYQVARNIETLMRENRDSKDTIASLLGISRVTLWRRLTKSPYEITLMEMGVLCGYWGISMQMLVSPPFEKGAACG